MLSIKIDTSSIQRGLRNLAKQIPFATARALTETARAVKTAEAANMPKVLDRPKPFTTSAMRVLPASKTNLVASVVMLDKTAWYLEPYEYGGATKLNPGNKVQTKPADQKLDQYGNIPRLTIRKLLATRKDVFIGTVGGITGVWQRPYYRPKGQKKGKSRITKRTNTTGKLKLLIRFSAPHEATQSLNYRQIARTVVSATLPAQVALQLQNALKTAR